MFEVQASDLIDEKFYMKVFDNWLSEYQSVDKLKMINFNADNMKSPKDFWRQLNLLTIQSIGQDKIMQQIEDLRQNKAFEKPEYYSRLKKEVKELCKNPELTSSSEMIEELDKKIKNAIHFYR